MKKSVSICIVLAMVLSLCGMIPTSTQAASSYEHAWFPAPRVYITQLAYESYSHGSQNAIDMAPGGDVFAPFTGKIVYLDSRWGYAVLQSTDKVYYADGTLDYMTVAFMHDENISNLWVGQVISQGTAFYQAGGMGSGNPDAYADHVHLSVHRGLVNGVSSAGKYGAGDVYAFDAFYVNSAKTPSIQKEGVMASGNYMTNGAPSNWGGRWKKLDDAVCFHDYSGAVTMQPSCAADGIKTFTCSKCGDSYTESIPATGAHSYGGWQTVTEAGCITEGLEKRACFCGATQTTTTPALGHDCVAYYVPATCVEPAFTHYECRRCTLIYDEYGGEWSEFKPNGVPDDQLEVKKQYRYSDYEIYQTYAPEVVSDDLISAEWMEQGTFSEQYVKNWPGGFDTSHELYRTYNNSAVTNSETDTIKITVDSERIVGYIYWHWCRGTHTEGPIDRKTSTVQTTEFKEFAAFYSTTSPSGLEEASDGSVTFPNKACCDDSWWYYYVPIYTQTYTAYEKLFTYGVWEEWSEWSETEYTASDIRKVEERTLYRSMNTELAECSWNNGVITTQPTCISTGVKTYTCTVCGDTKTESVAVTGHDYQDGYCNSCNAEDPEYNVVAAKVQIGTVSGKTGDTVTVPVSIADNPGIAGFTFVFDYDTSAMSLTGISKGAVLQDGTFTPNVSGKTLNWFNAVNVTENGVLFNLTFKVTASEGSYNVTAALKDGKKTNFVNENATPQRITFEEGKVQIQEPVTVREIELMHYPTKTTYYIGETLDTSGLKLMVVYSDGSEKAITSGFATSGFDSATIGQKDVTVTYEGKTASFTITVKAPEVDENAPQIVVSEVKGMAGDTVTVTVSLKNNPGFSGLNVYVTYAEGLTLLEATNSTSLTFTNDRTMVWDGVTDYEQDGELMQLTFRISDTAEPGDYYVKVNFIEAYTAELDDVTFATVDGAVQVLDFVYGDANGDGVVNTKDIILIRRHVAAKDPVTGVSTIAVQAGADANGDGLVNTKDIILVRRHVAARDPVTGESSIVLGPEK